MSNLKLSKAFLPRTVQLALNEDLYPSGDITSGLIDNEKILTIKLISNQSAIVGGLLFAKQTFALIDSKIKFIIKIKDGSKIIVGPSESMSKSKKNVIDPEKMIKTYGADAVRWFILSDSPPERDVQWSDQGVNAAYKFLQKIYNLNYEIINRKDKKGSEDNELNLETNNYLVKINASLKF